MGLNIDKISINGSTPLIDALKIVDEFSCRVVLVVDDNQRLCGIANDGDLRRAILKFNSFNVPVEDFMQKKFVSIKEGTSRSKVLDKMKALCVDQIPVLNGKGHVVALHTLREMITTDALVNPAVIMAGGKGTRLRPLTENIPKPMLTVAGRPILEHIIYHLVGSGFKNIYLSLNYKGELIEDYFGNGNNFGCQIRYLREEEPLGTAGALSLLPEQLEDVLLMNGDLITQFDVKNLLNVHSSRKNSITIGSRDHVTKIPYGVLEIDEKEHRVIKLAEKPEIHNIVNGGVYVISPELLKKVPKATVYNATDLVESCFKYNLKVGYHLLEEDWIDVGEHQQLKKAKGH